MSSASRARKALMAGTNWSTPLAPPAERELTDAEVEMQLTATNNVKDVPLHMLSIHEGHGDRNPYLNTAAGITRRKRCVTHIRVAGGWDALACETCTASEQKDDTLKMLMGAGRLFMADQLSGGVVKTLSCRILRGLTYRQELDLIKRTGTQLTKFSPHDVWRADYGVRGHEDVKAITDTLAQFTNPPVMTLNVKRMGYASKSAKTGKPALEQAMTLVSNTSLGLNKKYTSIYVAATIAILATQPAFNEDRYRHVMGTDNETFPGWLYDKALTKANSLGYRKPHARTITWMVSRIIVDELYNPDWRAKCGWSKLDESALSTFVCGFPDSFSAGPPKPKRKFKAAGTGKTPSTEKHPTRAASSTHADL